MKNSASQRRVKLRNEWWPNEDAWTGDREKGWFRAPRTMPLTLGLLRDKSLSGSFDPSSVYIELLSRHIDGGVIEMVDEAQHAFAAGFTGSRAIRSWQERMDILEKAGFIRSVPVGNKRFGIVLLVHPTVAVQRLRNKGKIDDAWWNAYRSRQAETKEATYEERLEQIAAMKDIDQIFSDLASQNTVQAPR